MSAANRCDLCDFLFEPERGCVSIATIYIANGRGTLENWSDFDFCPACSVKILAVVHPALQDIDDDYVPKAPVV